MKKLLVILAAIAITGCSSMGGGSSLMRSGGMGSGSSSMTSGTMGGSSGSGMGTGLGANSGVGKAGTGYQSSDPTSNVYFGA